MSFPSAGDAAALLIALAVLIYLIWTLLFPERM
ncbi:MAG: hypothetical protein DCC58_05965 [Chloroflexi bacterium]|nr:MAG: hypothetical protein DCC58_05965 [Chloroflexota bacterium]